MNDDWLEKAEKFTSRLMRIIKVAFVIGFSIGILGSFMFAAFNDKFFMFLMGK
jgi:hypothetical protein